MAQKGTVGTSTTGTMEVLTVMLLSELIQQTLDGALGAEEIKEITDLLKENDPIVIALPDTGSAKFIGSHEIKSGKSVGKDSKATFVVAELGSSFAGVDLGYSQSLGDAAGLPLIAKVSIIAQPPNAAGKTVDEALNRKVELKEAPPIEKTGTDA